MAPPPIKPMLSLLPSLDLKCHLDTELLNLENNDQSLQAEGRDNSSNFLGFTTAMLLIKTPQEMLLAKMTVFKEDP